MQKKPKKPIKNKKKWVRKGEWGMETERNKAIQRK